MNISALKIDQTPKDQSAKPKKGKILKKKPFNELKTKSENNDEKFQANNNTQLNKLQKCSIIEEQTLFFNQPGALFKYSRKNVDQKPSFTIRIGIYKCSRAQTALVFN
ncbi:hypothetical protein BpHYR1_039114 [Brachionus plicatilis]|uniref:Uncharacterized protein n=1 Tax=Brachionus plicatilis TaxID=10195 RepID=A0A3M7T1V1_BRAPC|nr:hypothetical protein BpHYR1_039114 [Brachionus plicatilis]